MPKLILWLVVFSMLLTACAAPAVPTQAPEAPRPAEPTQPSLPATLVKPSNTPVVPTRTALPTETFTPTPTDTPDLSNPPAQAQLGSSWKRPADGMLMQYVPAGEFLMCSMAADTSASDNEKPEHTVTLDAFWIDRTEVTNAMYALCVTAGKCKAPAETKSSTRTAYYGAAQYADYPVIYVSWD